MKTSVSDQRDELLRSCLEMAKVGIWGRSSPILARALKAIKNAQPFPSILQSAEDDRRETLNESDSYADSYYSLRDDGRNPDGSGESYTERNA